MISAFIYLMGAIVYGIFGTGEVQNWATRSTKDIEIKSHKSVAADNLSSFVTGDKVDAVSEIITSPQNSSFSVTEKESSFTVPTASETQPIIKQ